MDGLSFLGAGEGSKANSRSRPQPIYVLHGDEHFVKRRVLEALRLLVLGPDDNGFGMSSHPGDKAVFADVHDELETLPFLGSRRLVVIEGADPFVTRERGRLEKYFAEPAKTGVLVLEVQSWPANTRLAKLLPEAGTIVCKTPAAAKLPEWCAGWCSSRYGKSLAPAAGRLLVDLVGTDMGQLDQELAKLAAYVGEQGRIEAPDVDRLVGNSRAENTWKVFDLIGAGRSGEALTLIGRLFDQGEEPIRLLGAFSMQLRRLAQAARLARLGTALPDALDEAGVPAFARRGAEQQLRHLGRRRLDQLYDWLLHADLGLKGSSHLPPRTLLERLVVQLARGAGR
jgi:DNA polymerase-3 subunit delta